MDMEMEMEMDTNMDIPLPEELEWLEANSHLNDDYEGDLEPPEPYPDGEEEEENKPQPQHNKQNQQPTKPTLSIPPERTPITDPSTSPKTLINGKKRFRSDGSEFSNSDEHAQLEDKRSRIDDLGTEIDDEDWIRYSPQNEATEVVEPVVVEAVEKIVSRYASEINGDCIPVTGLDGDRVYAKMSRVEEDRLKKFDVKAYSSVNPGYLFPAVDQPTRGTIFGDLYGGQYGLISEPIHILMQRVETEAFAKALQASVEGQSGSILPGTPVVNEKLWVDKYAPKSFMELLSDEQTNREVLLWLKQWDSCVFGSEIRTTGDEVLSSLRRHSLVAQHQKLSDRNFSRNFAGRFSKETFKGYNGLNQENNDCKAIPELWNKKAKCSGPPERKIIASDDRSSSTIEGKILDVVQMNSVMADSKPKCLVIDEIDGALGDGKGAVEVILKMEVRYWKENVSKEEEQGRMSSRKKHKSASLSRPVICICNDLYAPALRPLRQVAKLKYICNKEGLKASSIALTALAEYTECDIRSCLNTLQFLHKKKETLNMLEISSQMVGRKDTSKSVFDVWKEIFQKRKVKRERKSASGCNSISNEFDFLHSMISNRGDYDLILDGIHENTLQLHYHDPVMQKTVAVHLLSEKEKNDMAQLVNTMVSCCITYKSLKSDPLPSASRHDAVSDTSMLSFDPPIGDLINFKGYTSGHFVLASAVRQVLVHEVEKQKILKGSINGSMDPIDACSKGNQTLAREENGRPQSSTSGFSTSRAENMQSAKNTSNLGKSNLITNHVSSASGSTVNAKASVQISSPGDTKKAKKPSSGSFNFFDRFRKSSSKGSQDTDNAKNKPATSERDSRPLLFKFNEGYTNAVKRPARIRNFFYSAMPVLISNKELLFSIVTF
ncbi:hypothetical protein LOK49_LG08G02465 [Camellia lanceoleosa]|uniref:Uncharacterized protein n=1 Tax=Camellia lanceoleosa TaxID=1840588 RepID=A0ACC0GQ63_9ERIC|nr:hypothetical protein LOK49_LG08G02465 [Camellia lanceoleosa]